MTNPDAPPTPPELERHIIITIARTGPSPHDIEVSLDLGEFDAIAGRAYIECALDCLEPDVLPADDDG